LSASAPLPSSALVAKTLPPPKNDLLGRMLDVDFFRSSFLDVTVIVVLLDVYETMEDALPAAKVSILEAGHS
jgi:hypothetical protein